MNTSRTKRRQYLRFAWSHNLWLHRFLVRLYNWSMRKVPFRIKYGWGARRRRNRPPYSLLNPRSVAVQVGAPSDTLHSGRSRGMYFALMAGTAVIIEPDAVGSREFARVAQASGVRGVHVINRAVWSTATTLQLQIDPAHPAASFTSGTVDYDSSQLSRFNTVEVPAQPLDELLTGLAIDHVDVLSLTTNGGEVEMLQGADRVVHTASYVCLRHGCDDGERYLLDRGFRVYSYDDRGITYSRLAS